MKYFPLPLTPAVSPERTAPQPGCDQGRAPLRMWKKDDLTRVLFALVPGCGERSDHYANGPPSLFIAVGGACTEKRCLLFLMSVGGQWLVKGKRGVMLCHIKWKEPK
jgi:hypothetical protein